MAFEVDYTVLAFSVGMALLKLFLGLVLTLLSIYYGTRFFDKLTRNIDELKELKKGNAAVGIMLASVVVSITLLTTPGIFIFLTTLDALDKPFALAALLIGIVGYIVTFLIALFGVYIAVRLLDAISADINKIEEIKKGNLGVGMYVAAVIFSISAVMFIIELTTIANLFVYALMVLNPSPIVM